MSASPKHFLGTNVSHTFHFHPSATIEAFMRSESFGRLIAGPVGSGKTTGAIVELTRRMKQQMPAYVDQRQPGLPRRFTRFAVIRQTLKQMKDTVLKDVLARYAMIADWRVSDSTLYWREGDIHSEWLFIPLDVPEDKKRLLSTNLTGAFINECVEIDLDLLSDIAGRCGRYPNEELGVPSWKGIICDTNMPSHGTPWAKFIHRGLKGAIPEWDVFKQPGGRDPLAENLAHLEQTPDTILLSEFDPIRIAQGRKYYDRLVASATNIDYIRRFVDAEFGRDPSGSAVYGESFTYTFHVRSTLDLVDDRMLIIGQDFGRNPASLITQYTSRGTFLCLAECVSYGMNLHQHVQEKLKPLLATPRFAGRRFIIVGDPAGLALSTLFELNEFKLLAKLGLPATPAITNDPDRRINSVEAQLLRQIGGNAAFQVDEESCPILVEGLNGAYRYPKNKLDVDKSRPEKDTPWSHIQDACQYACMTATTPDAYAYALSQTRVHQRQVRRPAPSAMAWT